MSVKQAQALPPSAGSTPLSLLSSGDPVLGGDSWRRPFARFPAIPMGAGALFVRFWAALGFPPEAIMPGEHQVEFQLVDPAGGVVWTRNARQVEAVHPQYPCNVPGWVVDDFNIHLLPPGSARLIVTPIVGTTRCTPMNLVIQMDDLIHRCTSRGSGAARVHCRPRVQAPLTMIWFIISPPRCPTRPCRSSISISSFRSSTTSCQRD